MKKSKLLAPHCSLDKRCFFFQDLTQLDKKGPSLCEANFFGWCLQNIKDFTISYKLELLENWKDPDKINMHQRVKGLSAFFVHES